MKIGFLLEMLNHFLNGVATSVGLAISFAFVLICVIFVGHKRKMRHIVLLLTALVAFTFMLWQTYQLIIAQLTTLSPVLLMCNYMTMLVCGALLYTFIKATRAFAISWVKTGNFSNACVAFGLALEKKKVEDV